MSSLGVSNIARLLDRTALLYPDRPSLTYLDHTRSVSEAAADSRKIAQTLLRAGVSEGDRVMLVAGNSPYYFLVLAACARIGAVMVPVSSALTRYEIQKLVDFCTPRAIICVPSVASLGEFETSGSLYHYVIDDDPLSGLLTPALEGGYLGLSAAMGLHDGSFIADGDDTFGDNGREYPSGALLMQIVAGERGTPRAVMLNHKKLLWAARSFAEEVGYDWRDTSLIVSPIANSAGIVANLIFNFAHGSHTILMKSFVPVKVLEAIEEYRPTAMFALPNVYRALLTQLETCQKDISSLRLPMLGGAAVSPGLLLDLAAIGLHPLNVWGNAFLASPAIYLPAQYVHSVPTSIGHPLPYIHVRIIDPVTLEDVPDGDVGELVVRGPSVVSELWHGGDYAADSFAQGWLRTGDLAAQQDSFLYLRGHRQERIVTGGVSIYPDEVENILKEYAPFADVAVCGVPDDTWGEIIVAAAVLKDPGLIPKLSEVQEFCAQKLAPYKLPRLLLILPDMPRGAHGAVSRNEIRELATSPSVPEPVPLPVTTTIPRIAESAVSATTPNQ